MNYSWIKNQPDDLLIVRDDLYPFLGGGNKGRKMLSVLKEVESRNCNAIVTTGGIQSNHCRVVALACAQHGWKCHLILHGNKEAFYNQKGNALIMRMCGAAIQFVEPQDIGLAMDLAMENLSQDGYSPYYLYGGGHNKAGVEAYVEAVKEFSAELGLNKQPDHIFLASGTGSTQAGILLGLEAIGWNQTKVHGISVARNQERGIGAVLEATHFINPEFDASKILFYDDYLFGGYGLHPAELNDFTMTVARDSGIILDTTYTGKAYYGMLDLIKRKKLSGNVLFWHTGGLLNVMC
ncbi:pyridoxal-phosphate dependent enzyme [uncultured Sunxiuqinia sp.]|uniref:1-aminocyclopropane-1-carboxylate deaminase/D-cysteine desulfhydrase n=1 Tax=uncultured Sunxiuqinia sp. TaxID=1573825 RepID=UPI002609C8EF|nr:pyridoxal-phosphate dependent enzyme [uncultured Sunxiuqinia sp.]